MGVDSQAAVAVQSLLDSQQSQDTPGVNSVPHPQCVCVCMCFNQSLMLHHMQTRDTFQCMILAWTISNLNLYGHAHQKLHQVWICNCGFFSFFPLHYKCRLQVFISLQTLDSLPIGLENVTHLKVQRILQNFIGSWLIFLHLLRSVLIAVSAHQSSGGNEAGCLHIVSNGPELAVELGVMVQTLQVQCFSSQSGENIKNCFTNSGFACRFFFFIETQAPMSG